MGDLISCPNCKKISDYCDCQTITVRGSSEYPGGPPMEPDETIIVCPHCEQGSGDWEDICVETLIEYWNEDQ